MSPGFLCSCSLTSEHCGHKRSFLCGCKAELVNRLTWVVEILKRSLRQTIVPATKHCRQGPRPACAVRQYPLPQATQPLNMSCVPLPSLYARGFLELRRLRVEAVEPPWIADKGREAVRVNGTGQSGRAAPHRGDMSAASQLRFDGVNEPSPTTRSSPCADTRRARQPLRTRRRNSASFREWSFHAGRVRPSQ